MLQVICVLRSGGTYDASWVQKLKNGCERHMPKHYFTCLSDVPVPCNRIPLKHDWSGWWSKIELFRSGVITEETLYLDLDTVITGPVKIQRNGVDFAMLQSFWRPDAVGSGVMYFSGENVPTHIYDKFVRQPKAYIAHHERNAKGVYVGDQAFISDCIGQENIARINDYLPGIKSYKFHCTKRLPADASVVCFHGRPSLTEVDHDWVMENWA
jgi:hypothetical protein